MPDAAPFSISEAVTAVATALATIRPEDVNARAAKPVLMSSDGTQVSLSMLPTSLAVPKPPVRAPANVPDTIPFNWV